jgi:hypothetical protein
MIFVALFGLLRNGAAQTVQYATVYSTTNQNGANLAVQTNQIISIVGYDWVDKPSVYGSLTNGALIPLQPYVVLQSSASAAQSQIPQIFTSLTNLNVAPNFSSASGNPGAVTFQITSPAAANVVSNYVPADAVVIPASATGNVQIILESSTDLANWTAASPGTYSAASATNRFFRVRAVCN